MRNVLNTVKRLVGGIDEENKIYDVDLLLLSNSVLLELAQNGVKFKTRRITEETTWDDLLDSKSLESDVAAYISQKVKIEFDPPSNSFVIDAMKKNMDEALWRINFEMEGT